MKGSGGGGHQKREEAAGVGDTVGSITLTLRTRIDGQNTNNNHDNNYNKPQWHPPHAHSKPLDHGYFLRNLLMPDIQALQGLGIGSLGLQLSVARNAPA